MTEEEIDRLLRQYGSSARGGATPQPAPAPSTLQRVIGGVEDVGRSIQTGLARGVAGAPGAPADIVRLGQAARDYMRSTNIGGPSQGSYAEVRAREDARREAESVLKPSRLEEGGSQRFIERAEEVAPGNFLYDPETAAGRAVALPAEMAGGALTGGVVGGMRGGARGLASTTVRSGVVPGAAVTGAQAAGVENPVALGAIGVAAGGAAEAARTRSAAGALRGRAGGATQAQIDQAEALFQRAQQLNLPLSRANALDIVTEGATDASGLQRVIEGQGGAGPMREFYAGSPQRIQAAGGQALDQIAPVSPRPSTIGPRAAEVMQGEIGDVNAAVNAQTRQAYQQIDPTPVPPTEFQRLMQNRLFAQEHARTLQDPALAEITQGLQPDSVGVIDLTRRRLAETQTELSTPGMPGMSTTRATGYGGAVREAQDVASEASRQVTPTAAGAPSPLEAVQAQQAQLRQQHLNPLQQGPEGRIAGTTTTEGAQAALFKPTEGAHVEVARAVSTLARRDPELAAEFVRNHLGTQFAAAQPRSPSGATYNSGPAYWKQVMGNPEQAASITAALNALPNGAARAEVFHDVMRVFQAMGQRQNVGSRTAFNAEDLASLKGAGFSEGAIKILGGGGVKLPQKVMDTIEKWRLGQNVNDLAGLFTDPARGAEFARIVRSEPGSAHRTVQLLRLLGASPGAATVGAPVSAAVREEEERLRKRAGGR